MTAAGTRRQHALVRETCPSPPPIVHASSRPVPGSSRSGRLFSRCMLVASTATVGSEPLVRDEAGHSVRAEATAPPPVPAPVRTQPATRSAGTRGTRGVAISFRRWRSDHHDSFFTHSFVRGETLHNAVLWGKPKRSVGLSLAALCYVPSRCLI